MLDIKISPDYESLDLGNITINFFINSPLFKAEINQKSISYNFTIVATKKNLRLLKIPTEIESPDLFEIFNAQLIINNSKETDATLYIKEANEDYIKLSLVGSDFDGSFLDQKLNEFDFGTAVNLGSSTADVLSHIKTTNSKSYPDTNYVFPMVYNPDFYNDENPEFLGVINNYNITTAAVIENTDTPVKNKNTIVPYFFLSYILNKVFELNKIKLTGSFITHPEIQKVLVHNNFALDEFDISGSFARTSYTTGVGYFPPYVIKQVDRTFIFDDDSTFPNEDSDTFYNTSNGEISINQEGILEVNLYNLGVAIYSISHRYNSPILYINIEVDGVVKSSWNSFDFADEIFQRDRHLYVDLDWLDPEYVAWRNSLIYFFKPGGIKTIPQITLPAINLTFVDIGKKAVIKFGFEGLDFSNPTGSHATRIATIFSGTTAEISVQKWTEYNKLKKDINPNQHMPNLTIREFINSYIKGFKLIPHYDKINNELNLEFFENLSTSNNYEEITDQVSSSTVKVNNTSGATLNYDYSQDNLFPETTPDISKFKFIGSFKSVEDLPTPESVSLLALVESVNAYYVSQITTGITFERYRERTDSIIIGDGSNPYLINYSPFMMDLVNIDNDGAGNFKDFLLPRISETGSSLFYKIGINDPQFKIFLWHGLVDGPPVGNPYPFASSFNVDQQGNNVGNLSLRLSEEADSAYVLFLKKYFNFLIGTKRVANVYANTIKNPLDYNFLEKKLIVNQRFLTESLKIKITSKGVESITAENYKI